MPYKQTAWGESVAEYMLYLLWDLGFKVGHATRTIDQCVRLSHSDMTIRTALLDARLILGDEELFAEFEHRFRKEVLEGNARPFIEAKIAEQDARHARAGASRYLVEPNIKDGKGGLRDLHTLHWLAKYLYPDKAEAESSRPAYSRDRNIGASDAARASCGPCAATCISSPTGPRSGSASTSSSRWPSGSAIAARAA